MSKKKKLKSKRIDEFRKLHSIDVKGHPAYVYAKIGKSFKYIGITHAEITSGIRNIPL